MQQVSGPEPSRNHKVLGLLAAPDMCNDNTLTTQLRPGKRSTRPGPRHDRRARPVKSMPHCTQLRLAASASDGRSSLVHLRRIHRLVSGPAPHLDGPRPRRPRAGAASRGGAACCVRAPSSLRRIDLTTAAVPGMLAQLVAAPVGDFEKPCRGPTRVMSSPDNKAGLLSS